MIRNTTIRKSGLPSALTLRAKVPNLDEAAFARMAGDAEKNCPVSRVLNASITLDAKLI
jgi:lipoyl-dependent peroxiredoxin